jgi:hypothetical protein
VAQLREDHEGVDIPLVRQRANRCTRLQSLGGREQLTRKRIREPLLLVACDPWALAGHDQCVTDLMAEGQSLTSLVQSRVQHYRPPRNEHRPNAWRKAHLTDSQAELARGEPGHIVANTGPSKHLGQASNSAIGE